MVYIEVQLARQINLIEFTNFLQYTDLVSVFQLHQVRLNQSFNTTMDDEHMQSGPQSPGFQPDEVIALSTHHIYDNNFSATDNPFANYTRWQNLPSPIASTPSPNAMDVDLDVGVGSTTSLNSSGISTHQSFLLANYTPTPIVESFQQQAPTDNIDNINVRARALPPSRPRTRKAPTLRREDWEPVKARVIELHIAQNLSLPETKKFIDVEFKAIGFSAK